MTLILAAGWILPAGAGTAAAALTAGLLWLLFLAWKDGYWSVAGGVHFTLVVAAATAFIWLLYRWGLLGLQ